MLIRDADMYGVGRADLRITNGQIAAIGALSPIAGEAILVANGNTLLPGLHDHHIHLAASAVTASSVSCGPPHVHDAAQLSLALNQASGDDWIRGVGYHEGVLGGLPDRHMLDALCSDRPLRIQHQSGRLWMLNSAALERLRHIPPPAGMRRENGHFTGHLFDEDAWLQQALGSTPPDFTAISQELARFGVTGVTDMSPRNDAKMAAHFTQQRQSGALLQQAIVAGTLALRDAVAGGFSVGPAKLHLHEAELPDFDDAVLFARTAHEQGRQVAVHCVSEVELVFALAVLAEAGDCARDRIEHVSVASLELLDRMAELGLHACLQLSFVHERGDRYLADVEAHHQPNLYRIRSLLERAIPMAGGSDGPYGSLDPWAAMAASLSRQTTGGAILNAQEALTPEAALSLYLADPHDFTRQRVIEIGAPADLCLLHQPWDSARQNLSSACVAATIIGGKVIYQSVNQAPL